MKKLLLPIALGLLLASCSPTSSITSETQSESPQKKLIFDEIPDLYVYYGAVDGSAPWRSVAPFIREEDGTIVSPEEATYVYEGDAIRIEDGRITALEGGTSTEVKVTAPSGATGTFTVNVLNRGYKENHEEAANDEGWYGDIDIEPIAGLDESFANGVDISSAAYIYERCGRYYGAYYNEEGNEQSLFQILADHDVNYVRLRLWVDPYNHELLDKDGNPTSYGGGVCDYPRVEWMAKEAKAAGLKVLLDFHYSDFYTDPSNQVIPKAWSDITTSTEMGEKIYQYTKETLESLKAAGALPDAVALGNETTTGLLTQLPGEDKASLTGGNPGYIEGKRSAPASISGSYGSDNFVLYLSKANQAVKEVGEEILTMVHMARGLTAANDIISYFSSLEEVAYDIIGLSGYVYYQWSNPSTLNNNLTKIANAFPDKLVSIAEHSYGFTFESDTLGGFTFSDHPDAGARPVSSYEVSIQGQTECVADVTEAVAKLPNGWGAFYWEPAWRIRAGAGWADANSRNSWANQGLFSYDGKVLGSLDVYSKMLGK